MKLAKALKLKNKVAGEVAQLKELLTKQNVRSTQQKFDYTNTDVLAQLRGKIDELVKVKAAIASANVDVYAKIFRLAELKGLTTTLHSLDVRNGVFYERGDYGSQPVAIEYAAQLKKVEVDKLVAELQTEIQSLQDELDEFNFAHAVNL
jgi:predicted nucleotide-binding protein